LIACDHGENAEACEPNEFGDKTRDLPPTWAPADELAAEYPELPATQVC
jgi:hypothetical protein